MATGPHLIVTYDYVEDILERRTPHREAHLANIQAWHDDGRLLLAGAVGDPPKGALFVFPEGADAAAFVEGDPYVSNGLVTDWRAEPWNVIAG